MIKSTKLELADIFRGYRHLIWDKLTIHKKMIVQHIMNCRTAALGGHIYECDNCGERDQSYNSCRDRHCPKCGYSQSQKWLRKRCEDVLPVPYFHVVFTIPQELNTLFIGNLAFMLNLLFRTSWQTLKEVFERRHKGTPSAILIPHTWGSNLSFHPHMHMVVAGGALSKTGDQWKALSENYLLPKKILRSVFRAIFLKALKKAYDKGLLKFVDSNRYLDSPTAFQNLLDQSFKKEWIVESRKPFSTPLKVLKYLSNYTHRMAITNGRILRIEDNKVYFKCKDYRGEKKKIRWKETSLSIRDFMNRFLMHVVPKNFVRIRYYGFISNSKRHQTLIKVKQLIALEMNKQGLTGDYSIEVLRQELEKISPILKQRQCPHCKKGTLIKIKEIKPVNSS